MLPAGSEQSRNMPSSIQSGSEGLGLPSLPIPAASSQDPESTASLLIGHRVALSWEGGVDRRTGVSSGETTVSTCCSVAAPPGPALHQDPCVSASLVSPLLEGGLALLLVRHPELPCFDFHLFFKVSRDPNSILFLGHVRAIYENLPVSAVWVSEKQDRAEVLPTSHLCPSSPPG